MFYKTNPNFFKLLIFSFLYLLIFLILKQALFYNYQPQELKGKSIELDSIRKAFSFSDREMKYISLTDSIRKILLVYNPDINQQYYESMFNYEIEELKKEYNTNSSNKSFIILHQLQDLYSMQYFDKKATYNSMKNAEYFKKNLEECEIGFQQMQTNLQLQRTFNNK